jgi:N-acetylglucosaminyl-diphospho-decaprenol L-rhamnosyltransferase
VPSSYDRYVDAVGIETAQLASDAEHGARHASHLHKQRICHDGNLDWRHCLRCIDDKQAPIAANGQPCPLVGLGAFTSPTSTVRTLEVDVVVVAYRSAAHLRACVEPLAGAAGLHVVVVDNACPDRSTSLVSDLPVEIVEMGFNAGFGAGCNAGAKRGHGEAILFLNPDARIQPQDVLCLARLLSSDGSVGACGPRITDPSGRTTPTMRRLPRLSTAFAEAFFLHHLFPRAAWTSEIVHAGYERSTAAEWLSGAVLCVSRMAFERVGGFDERFFLYCEDTDLCFNLRETGFRVLYEPAASAHHEGGASAPSPGQAPLKAAARLTYAGIHNEQPRYLGFRLACTLYELLRLPIAFTRSQADFRGRAAALATTIGLSSPPTPARWRPDRAA